MREEIEQHRKIRCCIVFLPGINLQERGVIRHEIADFCRGQPVSFQLNQESAVGHCSVGWLSGPSSERNAANTSSTETGAMSSGGWRIAGGFSTACRSDAQEARMARVTSGSSAE